MMHTPAYAGVSANIIAFYLLSVKSLSVFHDERILTVTCCFLFFISNGCDEKQDTEDGNEEPEDGFNPKLVRLEGFVKTVSPLYKNLMCRVN